MEMIDEVIEFNCVVLCPNCTSKIDVDINEVMTGGCYCIECDLDFKLPEIIDV